MNVVPHYDSTLEWVTMSQSVSSVVSLKFQMEEGGLHDFGRSYYAVNQDAYILRDVTPVKQICIETRAQKCIRTVD